MNFSFFGCRRKVFSVDTAATVSVIPIGSVPKYANQVSPKHLLRDSQIRANFGRDGYGSPYP